MITSVIKIESVRLFSPNCCLFCLLFISDADSRMNTPSETSKPVKMESGDGETGTDYIAFESDFLITVII